MATTTRTARIFLNCLEPDCRHFPYGLEIDGLEDLGLLMNETEEEARAACRRITNGTVPVTEKRLGEIRRNGRQGRLLGAIPRTARRGRPLS